MTKPTIYEWAKNQTTMDPTTKDQWEEGFKYLLSTTGGKVKTDNHDYVLSEITKAIRWLLDNSLDISSRVGDIKFSHHPNQEAGWIELKGGELSRTTDEPLWQWAVLTGEIVTQALKNSDPVKYAMKFGDGDGSTTFTLPNHHLSHFLRGNPSGVSHGQTQGDAIRNLTGFVDFCTDENSTDLGALNDSAGIFSTKYGVGNRSYSINDISTPLKNQGRLTLDASTIVPVSTENRPYTANLSVKIHRGRI